MLFNMKQETVIKVENIGKKYKIGKRENYLALRDTIVNTIKLPYHLLTGQKSLRKPEIWALKDVSFEVKKGEIIGIIGPNGAGKSTLLKIITRITEPTTGKITIKGRVASLLEVGTGFHPELTGRENIYLNGAILGMGRKEIGKKFDEIVEFAEIGKFLDTPVKRYSSGMFVRLAFSVAAHLEPDILLVDEILSVGDATFQKKSLGKMKDVSMGGRTVLFVSHNMGTIQQLTDRCLLLDKGKLILDGKTVNTVDKYIKFSLSPNTFKNFESKTEIEGLYVESIKMDEKYLEHGFNKPLKFDLHFRAENDIKDLLIILQIINSIGSKIVAIKTVLPKLEAGKSAVSLVVANHYLPPGFYNIDTAMLLLGNCIFSEFGTLSFKISDIGIEDWFMESRKDIHGVYPPVKYSIQKIQ